VTIWVVRHGRTTANASGLLLGRADPPLDDLGQEQARRIAAVLPEGASCFSSPLRRTIATAEAFASEITIDERLIELDYGDFDLKPLSDVPAEVWRAWRSDPQFAPPNGESLLALSDRVWPLLEELAPRAVDNDIVLFSHVSPIKAAVAWALGVGIEISWRCHVAPASIVKIGVTGNRPTLLSFNEQAHLEGLD